MSRLSMITQNSAQRTVEELYKDLERRIVASPPGLCPVDMAASFLKMCHAQSCGKCVPCRVGLGQLEKLFEDVLDGDATLETIEVIERTARSIFYSADCAIGYEAAKMVLKGIRGFREDFEEHILRGRCSCNLNQPVPCVSQCPAGVDIPGYIALVREGRYADAVRLIRKDNPMPAVCGLICEHPCEVRCRRDKQRIISNVCFYGHPDYEDYLWNKYKTMEEKEQRWESIQTEDAEIILVAYGISSRVAKEAVRNGRRQGLKLGLIRPITLWPYPVRAFESLSKNFKGFISVEMNILGQMVDDIKLATDSRYPIEFYGTFFDVPESEKIIEIAKEMLER